MCSGRKLFLSFLFVCFGQLFIVHGQQVRIGIFRHDPQFSVMVNPSLGDYKLFGDSLELGKLIPGNALKISGDTNGVKVVSLNGETGVFRQVLFVPQDSAADIKFKGIQPSGKEKTYRGKISIDYFNGSLRIINHLDLEDYLAGVVEAEAGYGHHQEFYKVQSIISRTYALAHLYKHEEEGFHLCDQVHCQAFKGKGKANVEILKATQLTHGIVIVDDSLKMITAAFHSNCGGQTANSEQVWTKAVPYLRSVKDPYCVSQPNAYWKKEITALEWASYLKRYSIPVQDSTCFNYCSNFKQPYRMYCLSSCNKSIPFKNMRTELNLKSTFFSVEMLNENTILLRGRGFGHGVGLCQEGAMKMAKLGFDYKTILLHYFTGVHIVDIRTLQNFEDF
ncbi:MAG: SpoIID/LytB domain-containing protein [Flavobacteriales bacterium]|nr:SpoIID/LytB domain-containing protein [Flavobacteriales bacterium]